MKEIFKVISICLSLFVLYGCATAPLPEPKSFIDQAIWPETTKEKVYSACLAALTMERFSVHPLGTNKESGIIVTKQRDLNYEADESITPYYTLQVIVVETQDNKVMVSVNAVDTGYNYTGKYGPQKDTMKRYISDRVADDLEKFFAQLDILLGRAEYYKSDKVLFGVDNK